MKSTIDHEQLFDQICGKLTELSQNYHYAEDDMSIHGWAEKMEKLKKSQDELKAAQDSLQVKIGNLENLNFIDNNLGHELDKISQQLEQERTNNTKLSADLTKSLEFNLKLQFEIEEVKTKATQALNEEKKHNHYLSEKNKGLAHELELTQALCQEAKEELNKAKEKFQTELEFKNAEVTQMEASLNDLESHATQQNEAMKNLSTAAEKKIIELKMALDKKAIEAQDYYSHLQQSLSQLTVMKQENAALKDYITKMNSLQKQI